MATTACSFLARDPARRRIRCAPRFRGNSLLSLLHENLSLFVPNKIPVRRPAGNCAKLLNALSDLVMEGVESGIRKENSLHFCRLAGNGRFTPAVWRDQLRARERRTCGAPGRPSP